MASHWSVGFNVYSVLCFFLQAAEKKVLLPALLHTGDPDVYQLDFAHKLTRHPGVISGRVNQFPTCSVALPAQRHK